MKILFLCPELTDTSKSLMLLHHQLGFEITVVTQRDVEPSPSLPFEWMCAMKSWSFFEMARLSMYLVQRQFDIIHGILDGDKSPPLIKFLMLVQNMKALHSTLGVLSVCKKLSLSERSLFLPSLLAWDGLIFLSSELKESVLLGDFISEKIWQRFKPKNRLNFPNQLHSLFPVSRGTFCLEAPQASVILWPGTFCQLKDSLPSMLKWHHAYPDMLFVLASWGQTPLREQKSWIHLLTENKLEKNFLVLEQPWESLSHQKIFIDLSSLELSLAEMIDRILWAESEHHSIQLSSQQWLNLTDFLAPGQSLPEWISLRKSDESFAPSNLQNSSSFENSRLKDLLQNRISRFYRDLFT